MVAPLDIIFPSDMDNTRLDRAACGPQVGSKGIVGFLTEQGIAVQGKEYQNQDYLCLWTSRRNSVATTTKAMIANAVAI
jgi:hypothetical protein